MGTYTHCNNAGTFTVLFNCLEWGPAKFAHSNGSSIADPSGRGVCATSGWIERQVVLPIAKGVSSREPELRPQPILSLAVVF